MIESVQSNSKSWLFFVKTSFAIAVMAVGCGVLFAPVDYLVKGYLGISALFLVSTTITLSKTLRDEHESQRLISKIAEAKTQQLIKELG